MAGYTRKGDGMGCPPFRSVATEWSTGTLTGRKEGRGCLGGSTLGCKASSPFLDPPTRPFFSLPPQLFLDFSSFQILVSGVFV